MSLRSCGRSRPDARVLDKETLPTPDPSCFDPPERLDAFLDALRWGAVTSADSQALQAPFRAGITIEDYQLDPVVRALSMPKVTSPFSTTSGWARPLRPGSSSTSSCCGTGPAQS
jgi:hypothetical protein